MIKVYLTFKTTYLTKANRSKNKIQTGRKEQYKQTMKKKKNVSEVVIEEHVLLTIFLLLLYLKILFAHFSHLPNMY